MTKTERDKAIEAAEYIRMRVGPVPIHVGVVLGSGLGTLAEGLSNAQIIPYTDIPHFGASTVPGHVGRLVLGKMGRTTACIMQGRLHYYEGYSLAQITLPIRAMRQLGIDTLIITNAAGGIRADLQPGHLMLIIDHLNLVGMAGHNPLRGPNDDRLGPRFPSMTRAYDPDLAAIARQVARERGIPLSEGVYAMVAGPNFETPAEVRYLRLIGADAVGMSTVPEVLVARHGGMRVLGFSLISNVAVDTLPGAAPEKTPEASHEEVLDVGIKAAPMLASLIQGVIERIT
ncbi:MAG: purine-nucleoside phosphorylase [Chloroflexi bacterium]|nr:purine-nucleoside phosphorylase [Chloroflexota bacterium]